MMRTYSTAPRAAQSPATFAFPAAAIAAALLLLLWPAPARAETPEEPAAETSGQISWVDSESGTFGLESGESEMEFAVGPTTVITRDRQPIELESVQPGDWVVSCSYKLSGEKLLCLRLEIQTPSGEEGLE